MDFDGDTGNVIRIHDYKAQREIEEKAFILNTIQYDHTPVYLNKCKGEAMYAVYSLLEAKPDMNQDIVTIDNIADLDTSNFYTIFNTTQPIKFQDKIYSYGQILFAKWAKFKYVPFTKFISANELSKQIYLDSKTNYEYHDRLQSIMVRLFWFSSLNYKSPLTFAFSDIANIHFKEEKQLLKQLPQNPYIGQNIYKAILKRIFNKIPDTHFFGKLLAAKLGKVKTQLTRISGAIGYIADDQNMILDHPITANLIDGLDPDSHFDAAIGSRKGLVDKNRSTPESGYLERSMVLNLSPVEIAESDCGTNFGLLIKIQSKNHAITLVGKYYSAYNPVFVSTTGITKAIDNWKLFTEADIDKYIGQTFVFRSPITCQTKNFKICHKCFGEYNGIKSPLVGIIAGQSIAERMTQLSLRTFIGAPA